jgi:hypothetical protein
MPDESTTPVRSPVNDTLAGPDASQFEDAFEPLVDPGYPPVLLPYKTSKENSNTMSDPDALELHPLKTRSNHKTVRPHYSNCCCQPYTRAQATLFQKAFTGRQAREESEWKCDLAKADGTEWALASGPMLSAKGNVIWIADSGASCHMGHDDSGMFDISYIESPIRIGNGSVLTSTKTGKKKIQIVTRDGLQEHVLEEYKYCKDLAVCLFAVIKALDRGWDISNEGTVMILSKGLKSL